MFGFKLNIQYNLKITDYLVNILNSYNVIVSPFRKNNQYPYYINVSSNHSGQIFKPIQNGIMFWLSSKSSNINIFTENKQEYELLQKR